MKKEEGGEKREKGKSREKKGKRFLPGSLGREGSQAVLGKRSETSRVTVPNNSCGGWWGRQG